VFIPAPLPGLPANGSPIPAVVLPSARKRETPTYLGLSPDLPTFKNTITPAAEVNKGF